MTRRSRNDSSRWSTSLLLREAQKNVRLSRRRLFPLLILAVALGAVFVCVSAFEAQQMRVAVEKVDAAGAHVLVFTSASASPAVMTRESCERLADSAGVERAGSVSAVGRASILPVGSSVPIVSVAGTLVPELNDYPVVLGADFDGVPGWVMLEGLRLESTGGGRQPEGIPINQSVSVLASASVKTVERCIAVLDPTASVAQMTPLLMAQLEVVGSSLGAAPVSSVEYDPSDAYADRLSRWLPIALGALGAVVTIGLSLTRSDEIAAYRMSGSRARDVTVILMTEASLIAGAMSVSGTLSAVVLMNYLVDLASTTSAILAAAGAWVFLSFPGLFLAAQRPLNLIGKER